jgi:hypothetical protein
MPEGTRRNYEENVGTKMRLGKLGCGSVPVASLVFNLWCRARESFIIGVKRIDLAA